MLLRWTVCKNSIKWITWIGCKKLSTSDSSIFGIVLLSRRDDRKIVTNPIMRPVFRYFCHIFYITYEDGVWSRYLSSFSTGEYLSILCLWNVKINSEYLTYTKNVPLVLILCIKSYRFISVCSVGVNEIALALFTKISMPPN